MFGLWGKFSIDYQSKVVKTMKLRTNNTLGYRGRIISLLSVGFLILFIRTVVIHQFGEPPHKFPIPAIIALIIAWQIGKFYDKAMYFCMKDTNLEELIAIAVLICTK